MEFAQIVADGDLTQQIDLDQKDEIGRMANALNLMSSNLNKIMLEISSASEQVSSSSEQLSASAQSLSNASTEQAANLEETSASIEELTTSIDMNAQNSIQADEIARKAANDANQGGAAVVENCRSNA